MGKKSTNGLQILWGLIRAFWNPQNYSVWSPLPTHFFRNLSLSCILRGSFFFLHDSCFSLTQLTRNIGWSAAVGRMPPLFELRRRRAYTLSLSISNVCVMQGWNLGKRYFFLGILLSHETAPVTGTRSSFLIPRLLRDLFGPQLRFAFTTSRN